MKKTTFLMPHYKKVVKSLHCAVRNPDLFHKKTYLWAPKLGKKYTCIRVCSMTGAISVCFMDSSGFLKDYTYSTGSDKNAQSAG